MPDLPISVSVNLHCLQNGQKNVPHRNIYNCMFVSLNLVAIGWNSVHSRQERNQDKNRCLTAIFALLMILFHYFSLQLQTKALVYALV